MPLVPPYIAALESYRPGRSVEDVRRQYGLSRIVKLASDEDPLGSSRLAIEAIRRSLSNLNVYPTGGLELRRVLAAKFELKVENVIAGSGSECIMANIMRMFLCNEDGVISARETFPGFRLMTQSRGVSYRAILGRDWRFDLAAIADAVTGCTKITYLANPNNPTGTIFSRHEFEAELPGRRKSGGKTKEAVARPFWQPTNTAGS